MQIVQKTNTLDAAGKPPCRALTKIHSSSTALSATSLANEIEQYGWFHDETTQRLQACICEGVAAEIWYTVMWLAPMHSLTQSHRKVNHRIHPNVPLLKRDIACHMRVSITSITAHHSAMQIFSG